MLLPMSRTKDLSAQRPEWVEDHLATQAGHSAHLRVFPKDLVVSQVVIQLEVSRLVIRLAASPGTIPLAAVSPGEAEASTEVAAIDK